MKKGAKKIIQDILLGAVVAISGLQASAKEAPVERKNENVGDDDKEKWSKASKGTPYKDVLQIRSDGSTRYIADHRSHRSHSSHRSSSYGGSHSSHVSHSSHRSSSGGTSHYSSASSSSRSRSGGTGTVSGLYSAPKKDYKTFSLGDRTLTAGLFGADVDELVTLLVQKNYYTNKWVQKKNGYSLYDAKMASAVKRFQKDAGISQTGTITASILPKLQNWSADKSTIVLGIRELKYAKPELSGEDVDELVNLLIAAGYSPDSSKFKKNGSHLIFTKDIEEAVKIFQAYNGEAPTGIVNENTLAKLRKKAK